LLDRPPPLRFDLAFPEATVVIACFNEEETIEETLDFVVEQDYPGRLRILVADDGSTDRTAASGRRLPIPERCPNEVTRYARLITNGSRTSRAGITPTVRADPVNR
jgi:hypothetical protein